MGFFYNATKTTDKQAREVLVTPTFFNYQILESMPVEKSTLFIVINDSQRPHFGGNAASGFDALLVHKSFEQRVKGERFPLC